MEADAHARQLVLGYSRPVAVRLSGSYFFWATRRRVNFRFA